MENTSTLPAINVPELVNIVNEAPAILEKNTLSRDNAVSYGQKLIAQAESHGMTGDLDQLMSGYLEKLRTTYKTISERRKPFTQIVDEVKKRFTALEADIAPTGKENIFAEVQAWRNQFATAKIEEQKRREREAAAKLAYEKEVVNITQKIECSIAEHFSIILSRAKNTLIGTLENMDLDSIDRSRDSIAGFPAKMEKSTFASFTPPASLILPADQVKEITKNIMAGTYPEYNLTYQNEVNVLKRELIDKIESKVAELEEIQKASAEEAQRLKAEAEARRKSAEEMAAREAAEAAQRAADEAAARAAAASLQATIDAQADITNDAPKAKEAYEIIIKNPVAYALIFQFWFEKEGREWPTDKIEKMTIGRMKTFCESWAIKNDEKISSNLIQYKEIYKAK
jgi:hypothetical protein